MKQPQLWSILTGSNPDSAAAAPDRLSLLSLVVANLLPIPLAILYGWEVAGVVMLYWWENLIVGFYGILRIAMAGGNPFAVSGTHPLNRSKLAVIPFFCIHYFFFCFVHGFMLMSILSMNSAAGQAPRLGVNPGSNWPGPLALIPEMAGFFRSAWLAMPAAALISVLLLFVSHGISFARNYIGRGEFLRAVAPLEMFRPYGRIVLLHVCIIFGGFVTVLLGSPLGLVVLFMIGKTVIDAAIHSRWHRGFAQGFLDTHSVPIAASGSQAGPPGKRNL